MSTHKKKHTQGLSNKELILKGENEEYATIKSSCGDCRFDCILLNGNSIKARIKGNLRKNSHSGRKILFEKEDFVLIQKDDTTTEKDIYFIINKYTPAEKSKLAKLGELKTRSTTTATTIIMEGEAIIENNDDEIDIDDI